MPSTRSIVRPSCTVTTATPIAPAGSTFRAWGRRFWSRSMRTAGPTGSSASPTRLWCSARPAPGNRSKARHRQPTWTGDRGGSLQYCARNSAELPQLRSSRLIPTTWGHLWKHVAKIEIRNRDRFNSFRELFSSRRLHQFDVTDYLSLTPCACSADAVSAVL